MSLAFGPLWPIGFLALLPLVWWVQRRSYAGFGHRQRVLQTAVRSAVIALLALAMMQPVVSRTVSRLSVGYVVDVSESIAPAAVAAATQWVADANRAGAPDHWSLTVFGGRPVAVEDPADLELDARGDQPQARLMELAGDAVERGATDLESAVLAAAQRLAPHHAKRLVVFSDGHETAGSVADTLGYLQDEGIRVHTVPLDPLDAGDAWVESVRLPEVVTEDEPFRVVVEVFSQVDRAGTIELTHLGQVVAGRSALLTRGVNHIELDAHVEAAGTAILTARLTAPRDPRAENNRRPASTLVVGRPRVLYVEGHPESQHYLQQALEEGGVAVEVAGPEALPDRAVALEPYAAVILSDVAPGVVTAEQMEALSVYVAELGGGFVMAGGDAMYGEEGYAETPVEELLPVTFSVKERPEQFSLIIVLDKSWSMVGPKIELSKEASKAAVDVLADHHRVGVVAFNNSLDWPVVLQRASNREWIKERISTIMPSGHTNIFPALEEAYFALLKAPGRLKHVILLSDGRTYPDDYEALVTQMAEAEITVSTVAMGEEADHELLANIADWGRGRGYLVQEATEVPQIFATETRRATRPTLVEEPFTPVVRKDVEMFRGIDFASSPPLRGYLATQLKETSEALLVTQEEDPILARWQFGLGKAVAFTSDVKNRWASQWLTWPGYGKFWTQLVRETLRRAEDVPRSLRVRRERDRAIVTIDSAGPSPAASATNPTVRVIRPDDSVFEVEAQPLAGSTYEAVVPLEQVGDHLFSLHDEAGAGPARVLPYTFPDELRWLPPDALLLDELSRETGGTHSPDATQVFAEEVESAVAPFALWPFLTAAALALYLADLAVRRIRVFERHL